MVSVNPRASGLWEDYDSNRSDSEDGDFDCQDPELARREPDGRTPLDKTIDRIGMGSYQWTLLSLCGFGWMADNMWMQAVAIILPRIQQHYSVPDNYIGAVSSSMFAGMMFGAIGWGTCSDLLGRSAAFNATLFFTALFGILASFSTSFTTICIALFFLGSSVGGSMPTDGTLLLEHVPKEKRYLVTALSVFFSIGAVISAVVAIFVVPQNSCPVGPHPCDVDVQNRGWKLLLMFLGLITFVMFLARIVFFRLYESPRYLVHAGRPHDAIKSLQMISRFNGSEFLIQLADVRDHHHSSESGKQEEVRKPNILYRPRATSTTIFDASVIEDRIEPLSKLSSEDLGPGLATAYASTGETHNFHDPSVGQGPFLVTSNASQGVLKETSVVGTSMEEPLLHSELAGTTFRARPFSTASRRSSMYEEKVCHALPKFLRKPLSAWWDRVMMVLSPEWFTTTVLVWSTWCAMAFGFTMFNVYLPKLLEMRKGTDQPQTLTGSLWEVVVFTIGGLPGSLLGAYLIESSLGRKWSLAGSTFVTAFFCVIFARVTSTWGVRLSTIGISLSSTVMWAILYGWTPEIFGTKVRGTACGIASALSRIGGMIAPLLGGILLTMSPSIPVYTSAVIFVVAGLCVVLLKEDHEYGRRKLGRAIIH